MERCPVPWSETPPPPPSLPTPPQIPPDDQPESPPPHPPSRRDSPDTPSGSPGAKPDAIQLAYSATIGSQVVEGNGNNLTVIRGMKSESPVAEHNGPAEEQLVYQTLGENNNGLMVQYGFTNYSNNYSPSSTAPDESPMSYEKMDYSKLGYSSDIHMGQAYETDGSRPISPASNVIYTYPYTSQDVSHSNAHPMWGALNSTHNSSATYLTAGLNSSILDPNDIPNGRGSYGTFVGNSAYLLTGNDAGWATLPPMSSPTYLTEGRRHYVEPPPDYPRPVDPPSHQCAVCGVTDTPSWKRDSVGQLVCSTCCIYKNGGASRVASMRTQRRLTTSRRIGMTCSNCSTTDTTLWRRNTQGEPVCNACGLYYKLHQVNRPISMRKDSIQTRKRKPKSSGSSSKGKSNSGNGQSSTKSPSTSTYMTHLGLGGGEDPHRLSPLLPSSAALSQQLPPFPPLDDSPLHHPSVISIAPNHKHM